MTGEQLKAELARIAEAAPAVHVPDDTFRRGRRTTTRRRVLAGAAAAACLALVAAVTVPLVRMDDGQVADENQRPGVPNLIFAPPSDHEIDLQTSSLSDVGPAAVAYQGDMISPVVVIVTADGDYRGVELPDQWEPGLDELGPVLSPDGHLLAYASQRDLVRGLSIVDLTTGELRVVRLGTEPGSLVRQLQWSPNSQWLIWTGQLVKEARPNGASYRSTEITGTVGPRATETRVLPRLGRSDWAGPGICDDGTPLRTTRVAWRQRDGFLVGAGSTPRHIEAWTDVTDGHGACTPPIAFAQVQLADHNKVLGWLPGASPGAVPTAVVTTPHWLDSERSAFDYLNLRLISPTGDGRAVGRIEPTSNSRVTVATGLMTLDLPTVPAGSDPWPPDPWLVEHWLAILATIVGVALAGLVLVRARAVRR